MSTQCDITRDLLPLYPDDISRAGRLRESPDLGDRWKRICAGRVEGGPRAERALIVRCRSRQYNRRSFTAGAAIAASLLVALLICLVINLCTAGALDWFFVVASAMVVAASLTVVPLMLPENKLFWSFLAFYFSQTTLLAVCCLYARGNWFFPAASASQFGLAAVGLPFVLRARPMKRWVEGRNRLFLALSADVILFANMMNMISLRSKGFFQTAGIAVLCVAGLAALLSGSLDRIRSRG